MIKTLLTQAIITLASSPSPRLDAEILLCHVLGRERSYLYTWPERALTEDQKSRYLQCITRRQQGEPIAYILGYKEFWSLPLEVTPATLIPRPETECLIEWLLTHFPADRPLSLADLGTGSGAIALALASERPLWRITATDQSSAALVVAKRNAAKLQLSIEFQQGSWCDALQRNDYDVIVSNPPYIAGFDEHLQQPDLRFEPQQALVSGDDGLIALQQIINKAMKYLIPGGLLILEHGHQQAEAVMTILKKQNHYLQIKSNRDYFSNFRFVTARTL